MQWIKQPPQAPEAFDPPPVVTTANLNEVVQQQAHFMQAHQAQLDYLIGVQTNISVNKMVADAAEAKRGFLLNFSETPVSVVNQLVPGAKGTALQNHCVGMADTLNGVCCGLYNVLAPEAQGMIANTGEFNTGEIQRQVRAGSFKPTIEVSINASTRYLRV
eukprot:GHVR01035841.1.p1 GENE.GHVR01035841.1~~GHVR01035841.1.p1  ORF type:complete len:161 (+),score=12.41 GHVR01035841.1:325-807(+)